MKLNDTETLLVAEAVKKVTSQKETEVLGKGDQDFIDLHSIDKKKRRGSEPLTEKDVEEANEFTKAAAKAAIAGDKEFDFDGKTYPVEMDKGVAQKILGKSEEVEKKTKEVKESTKEYAKSLEKIAKDRQMKMLSKKDRENLISIAKLLDRERKEEVELDEYVGPALTPANQIAKKHGGKVKAINVKDEKGKKTKMFYAEDEDEIEEALSKNAKTAGFKGRDQFDLTDHLEPFVKKNKSLKSVYFDGPDLVGETPKRKSPTIAKGVLTDPKMTVADLEKAVKNFKESVDLEEAIDPRKFALGGNTKATKRDVDAILSKIFMDTKLSKQVEGSKAYKAGFKSKGKGKNPYKKDTADFHLFILGQQSAQAS